MHAAIATPDLRLPSQPQGITAPWPSYTAWWQRHVCVWTTCPRLLPESAMPGLEPATFGAAVSTRWLLDNQATHEWRIYYLLSRIASVDITQCTSRDIWSVKHCKARNAITQNSWYLRIFCPPNFADSVCVIITNARSHIHCTLQAVLRCWQGK